MKLLWHSNAPMVGSGYGVQTALFGPRLAAAGHDVAFSATWGVQGWCATWDGFRVYPADGKWGNRTMVAVAAHHGDGLDDVLVIALLDAFVLDPSLWPDELRVALWAPVDHERLPANVRKVLARPQVTPVAMSRHGEQQMIDAGLDPLYVPHGVDTTVFRPRPDLRQEAREQLGLPEDAFVVGMVAANRSSKDADRKGFPQAFQAFARFRETHRDAVLYVHSNEHPDGNAGLDLRRLARACGLPRSAVVFTDVFEWELGWSRESLAAAYQAFDVLLNPSLGEGFGVPIVEAQACGVPVIVTDGTAMTELCGAGWLVKGDPWFNGNTEEFVTAPRVDGIVRALEEAHTRADGLRDQARAFALAYDADHVTETYWEPALRSFDRELVTTNGLEGAR